jgi:hypothetical protein
MGEYWFAAGLLLSIFGPLVFVLPAALLFFVFRRAGLAAKSGIAGVGAQRVAHVLLAVGLVAAGVFMTWLPGRLEFGRLCDQLAEPRILSRVQVDGFYLDDPTANSFGMRYLHEEGFAWIEARDIYRRSAYLRYRKHGQKIETEQISVLTATHRVRGSFEQRPQGINISRTEITELASEILLAEAHSLTYRGGPLGMFLGIFGSGHCPNPVSAEGSKQFNRYYYLVREVLGGGLPPSVRK